MSVASYPGSAREEPGYEATLSALIMQCVSKKLWYSAANMSYLGSKAIISCHKECT